MSEARACDDWDTPIEALDDLIPIASKPLLLFEMPWLVDGSIKPSLERFCKVGIHFDYANCIRGSSPKKLQESENVNVDAYRIRNALCAEITATFHEWWYRRPVYPGENISELPMIDDAAFQIGNHSCEAKYVDEGAIPDRIFIRWNRQLFHSTSAC